MIQIKEHSSMQVYYIERRVNGRDSYLHNDGTWSEYACKNGVYTGLYERRIDAEKVLKCLNSRKIRELNIGQKFVYKKLIYRIVDISRLPLRLPAIGYMDETKSNEVYWLTESEWNEEVELAS